MKLTVAGTAAWGLAALWLAGCAPGDAADLVAEHALATPGVVTGVVRAVGSGAPLGSVRVYADDGAAVETDGAGRFILSAQPPGARVLVHAQRAGYSAAHERVSARPDRAATLDLWMAPLTVLGESDARVGGTLDSPDGIRVAIPPRSFVAPDGSAVSGPVRLAVSSGDLARDDAADAAPGDSVGEAADGTRVLLATIARLGLSAWQDDRELALAPGVALEVSMPLATSAAPGEPAVALFRFDEARGAWLERGRMELRARPALAAAGAPEAQRYVARIDALGWWSGARALAPACVRGCVRDAVGGAAPFAWARADGVGYASSVRVQADASGCFTLEVASGRAARVSAVADPSGDASAEVDLTPEDDTGTCRDIGALQVAVAPASAPASAPAATARRETSVAAGGAIGVPVAPAANVANVANVATSATPASSGALAALASAGSIPSGGGNLYGGSPWQWRHVHHGGGFREFDEFTGDYFGEDDDDVPGFRIRVVEHLGPVRPIESSRPALPSLERTHLVVVVPPPLPAVPPVGVGVAPAADPALMPAARVARRPAWRSRPRSTAGRIARRR